MKLKLENYWKALTLSFFEKDTCDLKEFEDIEEEANDSDYDFYEENSDLDLDIDNGTSILHKLEPEPVENVSEIS